MLGQRPQRTIGVGTWGSVYFEPQPVLTGVKQVALGTAHSCAVMTNGSVRCWGRNLSGEAGTGAPSGYVLEPTPVAGLDGVTAVAAGARHTCALREDETVACWGDNGTGELGLGFTSDYEGTPTTAPDLGEVKALAVASGHSCAVIGDGSLRCWGNNSAGELGVGNDMAQSSPQQVVGLSDVESVALGYNHSCAALGDGTLRCWGCRTCAASSAPVAVPPTCRSRCSGYDVPGMNRALGSIRSGVDVRHARHVQRRSVFLPM